MSKQLSIASAFSILALSALALFTSATDASRANATGATIEFAAPALVTAMPLID